MKKEIFFIILLVLVFILLNSCKSSSPTSGGGSGGGGTLPTATATATQSGGSYSGGSIVIKADNEFLPEKGVVSGTGTISDPYIIEGWTIDASSFNTANWPYVKVGIAIGFTTKYFVIRNCTITNAGNYGSGISLSSAKNGKIQNCSISNCGEGIGMSGCTNIEISGCTINNCDDCISNGSVRSKGIVITGNTLTACSSHGIYFHYLSDNSQATNNIISGSGTGIYASALLFGECLISYNLVNNNLNGIIISNDSENNTITANIANSNDYEGIYISGSKNIVSFNTANYNGASGIVLDPPVGGTSANDNYVYNNWANYNNGDGFYLGFDCYNNVISNNTFLNNNQSSSYYYDMNINNKSNTLTANTYGTIYIIP